MKIIGEILRAYIRQHRYHKR